MNFIEKHLGQLIGAAAEGNGHLCVLLEARGDADRWMQLTWDCVNAAYPFVDDPRTRIEKAELPLYPYFEVTSWEPNQFVTFEHGAEGLDQIAAFVAAYLERVLEVSAAEESLRIEAQQL